MKVPKSRAPRPSNDNTAVPPTPYLMMAAAQQNSLGRLFPGATPPPVDPSSPSL